MVSTGLLAQLSVPYQNDFDQLPADAVGWSHAAISGTDDWEIGVPSGGQYFNASFSPSNAWATNLSGPYAANSERVLMTPYFNLTNTSVHYILSFRHKMNASGTPFSFKMEYKVGQAGIWQLLDNASAQKDLWQNTSGFSPYYFAWIKSKIDLFFLQGQDSVQFRFKFLSSTSNGYGWLLDDFEINERYNNLVATQGDTIRGVNQYFTNFTVKTNYTLNLEWSGIYSFTDKFYFSTDNVLDGSDLLLGNVTHNVSSTIPNWSNTFPLPTGLSSGNYYIFYQYDTGNVLVENNETDNQNFTVLILDSVYSSDYATDFDTTALIWNSLVGASGSSWTKGSGNNWHLERPRSGSFAWISGVSGSNNRLESPYLNLTNSVNTSVCFWYRASQPYQNPSFSVLLPTYNQPTVTTPYLFYSQSVPKTRYYGWDCHCKSVPQYDGEVSAKFGFAAAGNIIPTTLDQVLIDDVYIGSAKPDAGMGGETDNRFISSASVSDTLTYMLFNSGLELLPATTTKFYWSNDSLPDGSDILLGTQQEPAIGDTTFIMREFQFVKPTTVPGQYYIIYQLDADALVSEMREYDNVGYFKTYIVQAAALPYSNDFETEINGWRHGASLGTDDWAWNIPSGTVLNAAFSGQKAWITNANGAISPHSRSHLYTPVFDLSTLQNPVMEFDLFADFFGNNGYNAWPYNMGNIMYSVDGGNSWKVLKPQNESYKRWYSGIQFNSQSGIDNRVIPTPNSEVLYGRYMPYFSTNWSYQGRDYDENTHYVIDLSFLQDEQQVQFMFVYGNQNAPVEGMLMDNFEIKEKAVDLTIQSTKKLMVASGDYELKTYFNVKNNNNFISDSTSIKLYLSVDSVLDAGDYLVQTQSLRQILPYQNQLVNVKVPAPPNYGQYRYLVYELDPQNVNPESNELNNTGYLDLAMDSSSNYTYPVLFDFDESEIDGWTWWHDSTGTYNGHRFRHELVMRDPVNFPEDGVWFLDIQDQGGSTYPLNYPIHHLEPPAYDFSNLSTIQMEFDYIAVSTTANFGVTQGGNLSYSIDGGLTWIVLGYDQDPYAENWYQYNQITALNNEYGWANREDWVHAKYNLSFLGGQPNVRFRFNWRSKSMSSSTAMHGFRLDNFKIDGKFVDLVASNDHPLIEINTITQPGFQIDYEISNIGDSSVMASKTNFYWSTDTILDANDELLYQVDEAIFFPNSVNTFTQNIYYPAPLTLNEYYVLYVTDADSVVNEVNEDNNLGWIKIGILDTLFVDLVSVPLISPVYTSVVYNSFYFEFEYRNNGSLTADSSTILVHWSPDTILDASDALLYTILEPELTGLSYITNAGNVYFPHPVAQSPYYLLISSDASGDVPESNESNNFVWVRVNLDSTDLGLEQLGEDLRFLLVSGDGYVQLNYLGEDEGITDVFLANSIGQIVYRRSETISKNSPMKIDTSSLSSGIYYITVTKGDHVQSIKFFNHANR